MTNLSITGRAGPVLAAEPAAPHRQAQRHAGRRRAGPVLAAVIAALALALAASACAASDDDDNEVAMARADWTSGHMQAAIYAQLLEELGYTVSDPSENTRDPNGFYPALGTGQFDLWVNGWFPIHDKYLEGALVTGQSVDLPIKPVGFQVRSGALQGYMIDKATADSMGITSMSQLSDPSVAELFDIDGNGRADLIGCNEGWGCNGVIDSHIAEFDWGDNVDHIVGDYDAMVRDTVEARVADGEPVLFYAYTPNWTFGALPPGEAVVWLESPAPPDEEGTTSVPGLAGCSADPCDLGWSVNSIRAVANSDFLDDNPQVMRLLEQVSIPLADIAAQNAEMSADREYSEEQIRADAAKWIADNRATVDGWLDTARG